MATITHAFGYEPEKGEAPLWLPEQGGRWHRSHDLSITPVRDVFGHVRGIAIGHPEGKIYTTHGRPAMERMIAMLHRYLVVMEQDKPAGALIQRKR